MFPFYIRQQQLYWFALPGGSLYLERPGHLWYSAHI